MDNLYIVMPAYNEEANIEAVVRAWYPVLNGKGPGSRLVVADSGSTDGTHAVLAALCKELPSLEILENTLKQHGPKLIALYKLAIERGADYVFQTDSDGQTDPAEFEAFWDLRNEHDAVIGMRPVRGDGKARKYVEKVVCLLVRFYFGAKVPDANAPFRLMKARLVEKYINRMDSDYSLPNIVLTALFAHYGENITFREISFKARGAGVNSIDLKKIFKIGFKSLSDFSKFKSEL